MLTSFVTLALLAAGADASPRLTRNADRWVLQNAHLRCTIDLRKGGILSQLADAEGRVYWQDARVYSDRGLFEELGSVSTENCAHPEMSAEEKPGEIRVSAIGKLLPVAGKEAKDPLGCRVTYTLGTEPVLRVRIEVSTPVDREDARGFLALLAPIPGAHEWTARTIDGLAIERFGDARDRVWQSAEEALDPERPEMGAVWPDGRRLLIEDIRAKGSLQNVFWHQAQPGSPNLFLAFMSDTSKRPWKAADPWSVEFALRSE